MAVTVVALMMSLISCGGGGKYGDVKAFMKDLTKGMESFSTLMIEAKNADELAKGINKMTDEFVGLAERAQKLEKKYPDLQVMGADKETVPEELKAEYEAFEAMQVQMQQKFAEKLKDPEAAKNFFGMMMSPEVQEAMKNFESKMAEFGDIAPSLGPNQ